ncbi:hypothetical protein Kpol_1036p95 [Vanderwaltozyma polyspora DSM 70294]|uniref:Uncharacterized protein n=1 Tax=Vanderwaltozyma polyspora (strain ATCC 22028 / DSM 70294 / BCRC 21397 / CBS 2163 / NBRC 10782 / NRRL Y-8283 / UCD 57-17) TaxID=436907 RepID=A7TEP1_VANPO|nr:uncharacterized protein Kpol_1036p95 [Vanderwaltozyma polyspora DSM 70294]EDO19348.1 hypothetical protein Kpol_1036p95 [Vanderwaltozyma polyspora DSM 70294]
MSNPYDLLGNDIEDPNFVFPMPKELVKNSNSSKKKDIPPPSSNPTRAKKHPTLPSKLNETYLKDRSAGRSRNVERNVPMSAGTKKQLDERKLMDRHSRTGKMDTPKKIHMGWGSPSHEFDDELDAKRDARKDARQESEHEMETEGESSGGGPKRMSLQEYMLEEETEKDISGLKYQYHTNVEAVENAEVINREHQLLTEPSKSKHHKSKNLKEKEFLDINFTFSDSVPRSSRPGRKKAPKKPTNIVQRNTSIDTSNLPSLV